jgi:hypothetical protein
MPWMSWLRFTAPPPSFIEPGRRGRYRAGQKAKARRKKR